MKSLPLALAALALGISAARAQSFGGAVVVVTTPGPPSNSSGNSTTVPTTPINPDITLSPSGGGDEDVVLPPATVGETNVLLDIDSGIRAVPRSRVTVPAGERLRITSPFVATASASDKFTWSKNGMAIPGATAPVLTIDSVQPSDAGRYHCLEPKLLRGSQDLMLGVGPTSRLLNISTRGTLAAGAGQSFITGFVVSTGQSTSKKIIVRAVGPTLARFAVENPLAKPVLRIFDAKGKSYANGYVYPSVVGGLTYESDLASSLVAVGAFPTPSNSGDVVLMMPFVSGAYTAQVTSADASAGDVLVEIYEVP